MFLLSFNAFKHRSIFAVFLAIFLLFGAVKGTKAQESNGSAFDGLENLVGISAREMADFAKNGEHGKFPTDDKSQIFFLYNVKTGLLLNVGGYWGTHVSLQEYGMPLWVYKDTDGWIHFQQDIDKQGVASGNQEGCSLEYFYGEGYASTSIGVFVDRDIYKSSEDKTVIQRGWRIEPIKEDAKIPSEYTLIVVVKMGIANIPLMKNTTSLQPLLRVMWIKIVVLSWRQINLTIVMTALSGVFSLMSSFIICKRVLLSALRVH